MAIEISVITFSTHFTQLGTLVEFVAFILSYMGNAASATHVNELDYAGRSYPLALFALVLTAIFLSTFGGMAIAPTIPHNDINLLAGVLQDYSVLINHFGPGFEWVVRVLAILLTIATLAEIAGWIVGPSRGMLITAQRGLLPQKLASVNKHGVPTGMVFAQLVISSIALIVLTNVGGGNNMSFLIAMTLTVLLYLWTYFMIFVGYIKMQLKMKDLKRGFHVPDPIGFKIAAPVIGFIMSLSVPSSSHLCRPAYLATKARKAT